LYNNQLGPVGAVALGESLQNNIALLHLQYVLRNLEHCVIFLIYSLRSFSNNTVGDAGAVALGKGLSNSVLQLLKHVIFRAGTAKLD